MDNQIRLQVYLAQCGLGSRRSCEKLISEGKISVNGSVIKYMGTKVSSEDVVVYRGREVNPTKKSFYILLHKPAGYLCSNSDKEDRPLAIDLIKPIIEQRLFHIGRLDYMSSGLILYTNDGEFAQKILHPSQRIEKEYVVSTNNKIPEELMESFKRGMYTRGEFFRLKSYRLISPRKVHIVLEEGKNREIRKVLLARSLKIKKLHRIRVGNLKLGNLPVGHFRHLTEKEIQQLLKITGSTDMTTRSIKKSREKR